MTLCYACQIEFKKKLRQGNQTNDDSFSEIIDSSELLSAADEEFVCETQLRADAVDAIENVCKILPIISPVNRNLKRLKKIELQLLNHSDYVAFCLEDSWVIGQIISQNLNLMTESVTLSLMEPIGPSTSYKFPKRSNTVEVLLENILLKVPAPQARTRRARNFSLSVEMLLIIQSTLDQYKKKDEFLLK